MKERTRKRESAQGEKKKEPRRDKDGGDDDGSSTPLGGGEGINACQGGAERGVWDGRREEDRGGRKTNRQAARGEEGREESTSRVWSSYK